MAKPMLVEKAFRLIEDTPLFRDVPVADLKRLQQEAFCKNIGARREIMIEGSRSGFVALIVRGTVRIVKYGPHRDYILRFMRCGGVLGEIAALQDCPHTATVAAYQDCDLLCIPEPIFCSVLHQAPQFTHNLLLLHQQRQCRLSQQATVRAMFNVKGQLAQQLGFMAEDFGEKNARGALEIPFPLHQHTLADLLGACRESVNPALHELEEQNLLSVSNTYFIAIHQLNTLHTEYRI